jgi:hypothetical protein
VNKLVRAHLRRLQTEALRFILAGQGVPDELSREIAGFGWLVDTTET